MSQAYIVLIPPNFSAGFVGKSSTQGQNFGAINKPT